MALIALGSSLTLFILSFSSGEDGEGRRLATLRGRRGLESEHIMDSQEWRRRTAHLFSVSLALVFISMDLINLLHMGVSECKKRTSNMSLVFVTVRFIAIVFVATVSQWLDDPETLAAIGAGVAIIQVVLRLIGYIFFGHNHKKGGAC